MWRYMEPETERYVALPAIFTASQRSIQVQTNDMSHEGVYKFYVKGSVSLLYMFPEMMHEEYIYIDIVNPCR